MTLQYVSYSYSPAFTIQPQARTGGGNKFFQQRIVLQGSSIPDNESHYFAVNPIFYRLIKHKNLESQTKSQSQISQTVL
jgi:hypothetical protein